MDLVLNDPTLSCCGTKPCSCPDKMPVPFGLVDNAIDEDDVLVVPSLMPSRAETQIATDSAWCTQNAAPESDGDILPSEPPPAPTKVTCPQCNGTGTTLEENSPNAQFGLPNRVVECNLCDVKGFGLEGGHELSVAAPRLAAAMADRQTDNAGQLVYGVSPGASQSDFDENDVLPPNQL